MLTVTDLHTAYGDSRVLFGVDLHVGAGEVATLLGRNGMGKTTTIHSIFGLIPVQKGAVSLGGIRLSGTPSHRRAAAGLGLVPEGRQVFPTLTVHENLVATARPESGGWTSERIYDLFPGLAARRDNFGNQLSGGEQQMLAIGRALMTNPRLLVLDEATEGLAPLIRQTIWDCLSLLKSQGQSILVIDKNVDALTRIADRHHVLEKGKVVWQGTNAAFLAANDIRERYLHL
ncbi:ABC transporter ATP-binding protein [Qingshengfaniella alkalisoli]|uniref:ABC transporter ATP-binding protein n=1 Tax=Qingshengfaniella alkalisoli TaxID=2599296 RepID=A0A5B8IXQ1_9RHOB|nr:ABC transporter ATP-binding protein [Qingshengfaniella alkalisoli]QDY70942.1 ABC transporter ATP-binding protein [Qingshengfaniella alkalisoli]